MWQLAPIRGGRSGQKSDRNWANVGSSGQPVRACGLYVCNQCVLWRAGEALTVAAVV